MPYFFIIYTLIKINLTLIVIKKKKNKKHTNKNKSNNNVPNIINMHNNIKNNQILQPILTIKQRSILLSNKYIRRQPIFFPNTAK
jgi:hypothetical protein